MTAYIIARIDVTDPEQYKAYTAVTPEVVAKGGGRFVARGGEVTTLEGPEESRRVVVVEFDSVEHAKAFYESDEYQAAKRLRDGAATGEFIVVDGV